MACSRELSECIFCGGDDMTEEHIVAAWVMRAFLRKRRHHPGLSGTFIAKGQLQVKGSEPITTAKVVCRSCNNEWLSGVDNAAATVLKPLIRGDDSVTLDAAGQSAFAAWIYKCALMFDASVHGNDGGLASLRAGFRASRAAGPGCVIYAGPAGPPTPFTVPGVPEIASFRMFGVRAINGTMNLTVNVKSPDGTVTPGTPKAIAIPGYQVMLGGLTAYLGGQIPPITPDSLTGFSRVWPTSAEPVTVRPTLRESRATAQ